MKNLNKIHILNIFLLLLLGASIFAKIYLSDKAATLGKKLSDIDEKIYALEKQNEQIRNEYYNLTSLSNLSKRAYEMGLSSSNVEYYQPNDLALR